MWGARYVGAFMWGARYVGAFMWGARSLHACIGAMWARLCGERVMRGARYVGRGASLLLPHESAVRASPKILK